MLARANAAGRIKPHHAQPRWRRQEEGGKERKPLNTSKEIKSRVKSNSRGIVKKGSVGGGQGGGVCIMHCT